MAISQLPQAPYRQDRKVFPTPIIGDVLFSEVRDCNRSEFPEYGTPHPNTKKWPDHKLVYIKPVDIERNEIFEFFYAADRANQDLYNFSFGFRNLIGNTGGREFRIVQRTYVTLRSEFEPLNIPFGTPMPDVPEGKFDGVDYVFFDRQQQRIQQQELDSIYVAEVHTYVETAFLEYKLSYAAAKVDLTPEKFRASIPQYTTEELAEGLAQQPVLTGDQINVSEDQLNPDIKLVRTVERGKPDTDIEFVGRRAYVEGTTADVTETYSPDEITEDTGLHVVQSTVSPTGDGSFVKETIEVASWPELKSSEWDPKLNTQVVRTEQFVSPPTEFDEVNVTYRAVNEDRSLKITEEEPTEVLQSYILSLPTRIDLQLPPVLKSLDVIWSTDSSVGSGDSEGEGIAPAGAVGISLQASATSNVQSKNTRIPSLKSEVESVWGRDISATAYFFYTKLNNNQISETSLISRLATLSGLTGLAKWPIFKPKSHTIIAKGGSVFANAAAKVSRDLTVALDSTIAEAFTIGEDFNQSRDIRIDAITINNVIHGPITIGDSASTTISATVNANARVYMDRSEDAYKTATIASSANLNISVSPTSLPATSPADIPRSGYYVIDCKVEPYRWGWTYCAAIVIDASQFAS
jgi:hypothetical protein